ncbi:MAG TPA: hypothetical protein VLE74_02775 [Candidatus Saccharimonadales bacterium]|nr:hypothetical protein [Candidatus Saccharimonadales bacterium]
MTDFVGRFVIPSGAPPDAHGLENLGEFFVLSALDDNPQITRAEWMHLQHAADPSGATPDKVSAVLSDRANYQTLDMRAAMVFSTVEAVCDFPIADSLAVAALNGYVKGLTTKLKPEQVAEPLFVEVWRHADGPATSRTSDFYKGLANTIFTKLSEAGEPARKVLLKRAGDLGPPIDTRFLPETMR